MKRFKKKDLVEAKFIVDPKDYSKIEQDVEDEDIVHFVEEDETTEEDEDEINESVRPIISKKELIKFIKENKKNG